jgi:hypothetical protein
VATAGVLPIRWQKVLLICNQFPLSPLPLSWLLPFPFLYTSSVRCDESFALRAGSQPQVSMDSVFIGGDATAAASVAGLANHRSSAVAMFLILHCHCSPKPLNQATTILPFLPYFQRSITNVKARTTLINKTEIIIIILWNESLLFERKFSTCRCLQMR